MEPKPLFGNTSSPTEDNGRGSEPRPLFFEEQDSKPSMGNEPSRREPGTLNFSSDADSNAPSSHKATQEPTPAALTFALEAQTEKPNEAAPSPGALNFENNSTVHANAKIPGALNFSSISDSSANVSAPEPATNIPKALALPDLPTPVPAAPRAQALFAEERHPAQTAAEAAARRLEPGLFDVEESRIRRLIGQLLPVTVARLQDFADAPLRAAQSLTHEVAELTTRFAKLDAAETLEDAVEACSLKSGFFDKLKARFSNPTAIRPRLEALEKELSTVSRVVADALPRSDEYARALVLHLIALRAVEQIAGTADTSPELNLLHQRLDLLRSAGQQAQLVNAQLKQLQATLASLENKCEHILTVTLSAVALAKANARPA